MPCPSLFQITSLAPVRQEDLDHQCQFQEPDLDQASHYHKPLQSNPSVGYRLQPQSCLHFRQKAEAVAD
jgi:hypothetical protein